MSSKLEIARKTDHLPTVAIVGRPNVGKSSLFNALIGRRLSIVHEMSGVTRDRVVAPLVRGGRHFQLIDTGGLGMLQGESRAVNVWDSRIADQVEAALEGADVLIQVANVQEGLVTLDAEVADRLRASGKPVIFVANKCDNSGLIETARSEFRKLGFDPVYPVSCLHRSGMNALLDAVLPLLPEVETTEDSAALNPDGRGDAVNIAVIGRPNVGKSSLVNALLGEERVMVSDVAGTTRDAIDIDFTLRYQDSERPAVLVDTAGMRKNTKVDDIVEYFSVMRAKAAIARADLVLFVVEASPDGVTAQDKRIAGMIEEAGKGCVIVANKFDLCRDKCRAGAIRQELRRSLPWMGYAPLVLLSARERSNLGELLDQMAEVMEQLEVEIPTGVLNRVLSDAMARNTPPVTGPTPLKMYYASMVGRKPPKILMFVNNPKNCADHYRTFLKNTLRQAFDLSGLPIELELRARPKKVESIRREPERNNSRKTRRNTRRK